jgi:hypothetical protein
VISRPRGLPLSCERFTGSVGFSNGKLDRTEFWRDLPDYVFAFHDREEIGPRMLTRIARHTGLRPDDL